ncbi:MAG TPA: PEP-CTERM sorting domain-containing protein [Bryobacteraceae bacterium]|nr:PEP-CTERM sorting domain-containing protein [Bryobacteraceae bacterium]
MKTIKIVGLSLFAFVASGATITYVTPTGSTLDGLPENVTATFTTGLNSLTVTVENLQTNPTSVIQALSDLAFTFSTGQTAGSLTSSSTTYVDIATNGTYAISGSGTTGWALETNTNGGLRLCVLCTGGLGPEHLLIGGPNSGTNTYSNANGSIAGNGPHNPFDYRVATFTLAITGLTVNSTVNSATFSFGTTEGRNITGVPGGGGGAGGEVPEPSTWVMLGSALAALAFKRTGRLTV